MLTRDQIALQNDTVDVADLARTIRRQWRALIGFTVAGMLVGAAIMLFAPKRYDAQATVLARTGGGGGANILGRMAEGAGALIGGVGGGGGGSLLETELQMLRSRTLAGQAVDSLLLNFNVVEPAGTPPSAIVASHSLRPSFGAKKYEFFREASNTWSVRGDDGEQVSAAIPGRPLVLSVGAIVLHDSLPARFELEILDREDAITEMGKHLEVNKAGGEVARIEYRAADPVTAAAVPNALVHFYMERRRTVDRGANQRRVEYVEAQVQSTAQELATAEREWRRNQEQTGVFDPEISGENDIASASRLREQLANAQVDAGTVNQLLAQVERGAMRPRELAAYPSFSSLAGLAGQVNELEVQRTRLLERRTPRDPEVQVIDSSISSMNATIVAMAKSYANAASQRRNELQTQVDSAQRSLLALPAAGERVGRLKRDVIRLTELYTALQAQLVEARLGAIGEGGDIRQLDVATTPKGPAFPNMLYTMGIGTAGGVVVGVIAALFLGWFGRWLRDPHEVERALGIATLQYSKDTPLMLGGAHAARTLLVVPLDVRAQSRLVAEGIARTATARALSATVLDLSASVNGNGNGTAVTVAEHAPSQRIDQMEQQGEAGLLVVQLPTLNNDTTLAALRETRPVLLVAPPGPVDRARLSMAVSTLRRLEVPVVGIVMSEDNGSARSRWRVRGPASVT
jgi:uncharacterized protein involved in exopolysaccharide biosynthesis